MTYPQQPGFPPVPGTAAPTPPAPGGYPQPPAPQYMPQGFPAQQPYYPQPPQYGAPQQPAPQLAAGSLDAFFSQPSSGGGAALKFEVNTAHVGVVSRPLTHGDVQQQTNPGNGQPSYYKDGRPKFVMKVPLKVAVSQAHSDGQAQWFVAGAARDELLRAQLEAGAPEGPPEAGAVIYVQCTGTRPSGPGMNPAKTYAVRYWRPGNPEGLQFAAQCGIDMSGVTTGPAAENPAPAPVTQGPQAPAPQAPQGPPAPPAAPIAQAPAPQPPAPAANSGLSPEQQALLAQLTGQSAPTS